MNKKFHIKKGDTVLVLAGDSKTKQGKVLEILTKSDKAIVEGVNLVKKNTKPNAAHPQGGILEKEAPIHISNLMLVDPSSGKPTRVGRKLNKNEKLVRYSKKSGEEIK